MLDWMVMAKNLEISRLLDVYGQLLPERRRGMVEDYYNFDLSLGEIAENCGITRQGVSDALKVAEKALFKYESILHLCEIKEGIVSAAVATEPERGRIIERLGQL